MFDFDKIRDSAAAAASQIAILSLPFIPASSSRLATRESEQE